MCRVTLFSIMLCIFSNQLLAQEGSIHKTKYSSIGQRDSLKTGYYFEQNYPNPMSPCTSTNFGLNDTAFVKILILSQDGDTILTVCSDTLPMGNYMLHWGKFYNDDSVKSGIYFFEMTATTKLPSNEKESGILSDCQTRFYCKKPFLVL